MQKLNFSQERKLNKLAEKYQLRLVILFGSRVKEKLHQESDFDIAYLPKKELSGKGIIDLNCDLMEVFKTDKVDLVDLRKVNPFLRFEIAKKSQLLYGKEMDYLNFKAFAFKDYINHLPLFDLESVLIKRKHELLRKKIYAK